jgi:hypothetical protein
MDPKRRITTPAESASTPEAPTNSEVTKRWSRRHKPTQRLIESREQAIGFAAVEGEGDGETYDGEAEYEVQRKMEDPIAFAASSDPDTMYLHEAMKQPDRQQFIQAMIQEVTTHTERGHWEIMSRNDVPEGWIYFRQFGR